MLHRLVLFILRALHMLNNLILTTAYEKEAIVVLILQTRKKRQRKFNLVKVTKLVNTGSRIKTLGFDARIRINWFSYTSVQAIKSHLRTFLSLSKFRNLKTEYSYILK